MEEHIHRERCNGFEGKPGINSALEYTLRGKLFEQFLKHSHRVTTENFSSHSDFQSSETRPDMMCRGRLNSGSRLPSACLNDPDGLTLQI